LTKYAPELALEKEGGEGEGEGMKTRIHFWWFFSPV